ncbi:MAG: hypothetical protein IRD7MM_06815 [Candidatus Midichloria mitochondrii]|uniref:Uncharacterized protein n=1 Tax=Midichloria mitochondrii (strain IricVA) TaxID=696127 RepID=F7XX12_MIDMI|nr:hypothetical protein [Candidatus Midichloria mitochondrii]AEI89211.1 hypothetical protein midi_00928 [Candidatus Midichloria mitochondrii IricVA]MDJ1256227.1 hypothetical protein [Candidatus Midichloria mitochondrii]MDJ1288518.1 hypothetical protein [Candidatus Midichloria mitochondrii]MDJ1299362.1 hypothetical protein [Candidatus Midichloria mitochondrii]MDJ1312964.1 hypothetical protein [Candidatus Midichloria mitochondrii]
MVNSNMQQINQDNLLEIINFISKAQSITEQKYIAICELIEDELTLKVEKIIYNNNLRINCKNSKKDY